MRALRILPFFASLLPAALFGQTLYWDTDGATPGLGQSAGAWNAPHWSTSASGDVATGNWSDGATAVFTDYVGVAVSFDSNYTLGGLTLVNSGSLALSGTGALTFAPGAVVQNNGAIDFDVNIAGGATPGQTAFTLNGSYDVYFKKANTFTGKLIINGGDISATTASAFGASGVGNETYLTNNGGQFLDFENDMTVNEGFVFSGYRYVGTGDNNIVTLAGPIVLDGGGSMGIWSGDYLTISGVISEANGAGTFVSYAKLTGNNTFSGVLQVGGTTIESFGTTGEANPLGLADTVQLGYDYEGPVGGTLHYAGTAPTTTTDRKFTLYGEDNAIDVVNQSSVLVLTGQISKSTEPLADSQPNFVKEGPGTLILRGDNTYPGDTLITNGTLIAGHNHAFGTDSESELEIGTYETQTGDNLGLLLEDGITLDKYIDVYGQNYEGSTVLGLANTGTAAFVRPIYLQRDIDVKVNSGGTLNFEGQISDGVSGGGLRKIGAGTAVFKDGIDLRVGGLVVDDGKVVLHEPGSVNLAGGLKVSSGGSLGFASATGTLTLPSLNLDGGNLVWRLGDLTTNTLQDRFVVESPEVQGFSEMGSALAIAEGSTLTLDLSLLGISQPTSAPHLNHEFWQSVQVWTLIAFSGGGTNDLMPGAYNPLLVTNASWAGGTFETFVGGGTGDWANFTSGDVFLRFQPVPEPSTWALLGLGGLMAGLLRWRRRA